MFALLFVSRWQKKKSLEVYEVRKLNTRIKEQVFTQKNTPLQAEVKLEMSFTRTNCFFPLFAGTIFKTDPGND